MSAERVDHGKVSFRMAEPDDLQTLLDLERAAHSYPWSEEILSDMLSATSVDCYLMQTEQQVVLGFAFMQSVADEASLLNLVIRPMLQGQGLGRLLLSHVIEELRVAKIIETLFLEVRVSNFAAISLYLSFGFVEVGERRDYYPARNGVRENGLMMALPLAPHW